MIPLKRIYLLSEAEIADLYARPHFNAEEQKLYFSMTQIELEALNHFFTLKTRVSFILQLAYFKARHQFFQFKFEDVRNDIDYILVKLFKIKNVVLHGSITRQILSLQRQKILTLFNYQNYSVEKSDLIKIHLGELLRYYPKVHDTFRQLLVYLDHDKIVIPSYRILQDLLTQAYLIEKNRLDQLILSIPQDQQQQLSELIIREDGISALNIIRSDQKNFQYHQIKAEIDKAFKIADLYKFAKIFLPTLELSKNAMRYYADLAEQYAASRLRRLSKSQQWLQTLCFVYHRFQQIMDNLITSFIYHTRAILEDAKTYALKAMLEHNSKLVVDLPRLARFLKWFPNRKHGLNYEELNDEAYKILPEAQFITLAQFLQGNTFDKKAATWEFYSKSSRLFALYLRPIMLIVPFEFYKPESEIMNFINLIKNHYNRGKTPASLRLPHHLEESISKTILPYLKKKPGDEHIDPHLFEFFVYQKMYRRLDKGLLCCNDSVSYCDINYDLISDGLVDDVEKIANKFGYPKIPVYCDERLDEALKTLDEAWVRTTQKIGLGENSAFNLKVTKTGEQDWSLNYQPQDKFDDSFFKTLPQIEILDIVMYIGDRINMWRSFTHMKTRYNKKKRPVVLALNACLLSEAFGMSTEKMAEMSDLNYNLLRSTREDFIRVDNIMCC